MTEELLKEYSLEVKEKIKSLETMVLPNRPIVFYGSSSFRLWDTVNEDLKCDRIVNLAFGGSITEAVNYFFDDLVKPLNPVSLVLYVGDNDVGTGLGKEVVIEQFKLFYTKFRKEFPSIPFTYVSIKPSIIRFDKSYMIRDINQIIKTFIENAEEKHLNSYIDIFHAMYNDNGTVNKGLFIEDELHMNKKGYEIWTKIFSKDKEKWLHE